MEKFFVGPKDGSSNLELSFCVVRGVGGFLSVSALQSNKYYESFVRKLEVKKVIVSLIGHFSSLSFFNFI